MLFRTSVPRVAPNIRDHRITNFQKSDDDEGDIDCDCGAPTRRFNRTCERCRFLDQSSSYNASEIVSALRISQSLDLVELAKITDQSTRNTYRLLQKLVSEKRCEKFATDVADSAITSKYKRFNGTSWKWVYRLI